MVKVVRDIYEAENDNTGQLVVATGKVTVSRGGNSSEDDTEEVCDHLFDPLLGVKVTNAIRLERRVECFQWIQID